MNMRKASGHDDDDDDDKVGNLRSSRRIERDVTEQILTDAVVAMSLRNESRYRERRGVPIGPGFCSSSSTNRNSTSLDDLPPQTRYVVPDRVVYHEDSLSENLVRRLHEEEKRLTIEQQQQQQKQDEHLAKAIAMVEEDYMTVLDATVVPQKKKKKKRRSSIFRRLFRRLGRKSSMSMTQRRREKFMKKIEMSLSEGSPPPPPPVRVIPPMMTSPRRTIMPVATLIRSSSNRSSSSSSSSNISSPLHRDLVALASRLTEEQQIELARVEQDRLHRELVISRNLNLSSYEDLVRLDESNVKVNVAPEELSQFPVYSYRRHLRSSDSDVSNKDKECTICTDLFRTNEKIRRLPCFHIFHRDCIDEWFQRSRKCPICMTRV